MKAKYIRYSAVILIAVMIGVIFTRFSYGRAEAAEKEFRGIWVSSVWGLDYPSKATTDDVLLKKDVEVLLDNVKAMGFNAVFLQVRSCSDALYKSDIFPWSKYLTGTQGIAPNNGFDPLEYFIEESHKRGLELHAWINPYRVTATPDDNKKMSKDNPAVKYPELTVMHTDGKLYYNPGEPEARQLVIDGVKEIIENYNVDGIHLDDYFYPGADFPDYETYQKYGYSYSDIQSWRRENNNILIRELKSVIKSKDDSIQFGVSPAGVWANKSINKLGSDTNGSETYTREFADSRLWVKEEYVDYIAPQIYWSIGYKIADYSELISWWSDVVDGTNVKFYVGQAAYRTVDSSPGSEWYKGDEIKKQVLLNRESSGIDGYCMFAYNSFMKDNSLKEVITDLNKEQGEDSIVGDLDVDEGDGYKYVFVSAAVQDEQKDDYMVVKTVEGGEERIIAASRYKDGEIIAFTSSNGAFEAVYNEKSFEDIYGHVYEDSIKYMAARDVIKGSYGKFNPDNNIKRADLVLMLMRMLEIKNTESSESFLDVDKSAYYSPELTTAKVRGLINGIGDNMFAPEKNIKRQDVYVIVYRAMEKLGLVETAVAESYADVYDDWNAIDNYAKLAVGYFAAEQVLDSDNTIRPDDLATRGEVAEFLSNILKSSIIIDID